MMQGLMGAAPWRPTSKRSKPFEGAVRIGAHSGIRKLQRAMRRGKVPDERQGLIENAMQAAESRRDLYANTMAHGAPRWS